MRENLPKEMDFIHEASNAARAARDFEKVQTSLYIPKVLSASKRILIMEFIEGSRVDDLSYLAEHDIDRNKVSLELQRIFCQMVFINGWFHAVSTTLFIAMRSNSVFQSFLFQDPHHGNLLIRPAPDLSKSPYNFEIVLLDHGLYFDIDNDLRVNYSHFWLSLISPASSEGSAERRKYAELVGNIGPELVR